MNSKRIDFIGDLLTVRLLPIEILKPHEKYCPNNFNFWLEKINSMQCWTHPLLVDKNTKVIMDGHHRHQIAHQLGLKYIPCILTSYKNPYIKVYLYKDNSEIDNQLIIKAAQSGRLFDSKSTRHELTINCIPQINVPLALLQ